MTTTPLFPIALSSQLDSTGVERVHAADLSLVVRAVWEAPPPPPDTIYIARDFEAFLRTSLTGSSFPTQVPTGMGLPGSEIAVQTAGGKLYHLGQTGLVRVSSDGVNFAPATGIFGSFNTPGSGVIVKVGSEWQLYSSGMLHVSTDGIAFTERVAANNGYGAHIGNTIVYGGSTFGISLDAGVTFSTYARPAAFASSSSYRIMKEVPGQGFIYFANSTGNNLAIATSSSGLSGSWVMKTAPTTFPASNVAVDPTTNRIFLVVRNTSNFTFDLWTSDDFGNSWTARATGPMGAANDSNPRTLIWYNGWLYYPPVQGGGVTRIYRTDFTGAAWSQVASYSGGLDVNSMCGFPL